MKSGELVTDLMLFAGAVVVSYGAGLLEPAAGFIAGGVFLLAGGVMRGRAEACGKRGGR